MTQPQRLPVARPLPRSSCPPISRSIRGRAPRSIPRHLAGPGRRTLAWLLAPWLLLGSLGAGAWADLATLPGAKATPAAAVATASGTGTGSDGTAAAKPRSLPVPPKRPVPGRSALHQMIDRAADQYGIERDLVHAVVMAESAYNPNAVSPAGAVGIMQVMPATAGDYGVKSVDALFDPQTNIRTGVRHLKRLLNQHGIGKAVMAYNAGEGALARHNGFVTYAETQRYTHRVLTSYLRKKGLSPYSKEATALTGLPLSPAMASASGGGGGGVGGSRARKGKHLRHVDASRLSLRIRPTLSNRALDPAAHRLGPDSQPMFVLERN